MLHKRCELCHELAATLVCEQCGTEICSVCSDCLINDPEDITTWVILCDECLSEYEEEY